MRFCSIFNQLLQLFPRLEFQRLVQETKSERHARGFTCWGQFVAMLFCQLGHAHSLREIVGGLASCEGRLAHLGITAPRLKLEDVSGRALVIHEGGDNYTDNPENGGGKSRIACGVIPKG